MFNNAGEKRHFLDYRTKISYFYIMSEVVKK